MRGRASAAVPKRGLRQLPAWPGAGLRFSVTHSSHTSLSLAAPLPRPPHLLKLDVGKAAGAAGVTVIRHAHLGNGAAPVKELADGVLRSRGRGQRG